MRLWARSAEDIGAREVLLIDWSMCVETCTYFNVFISQIAMVVGVVVVILTGSPTTPFSQIILLIFLQTWSVSGSHDSQLQVCENYIYLVNLRSNICNYWCLTLSGLSLPLSSSTTTSRELLPQFSTCSGWRWFDVGEKFKKIAMYW